MNETNTDYFPALMQRIQAGAPAQQLLAQAADEYPRDPRPLLLLAAEFMHEGQVDRAEAAYVFALHRAPDFAIARFQLGLLQWTSGRPAAAIATWAPLDALDPAEPLRLFKQGLTALAQDQFEDARRWILEGIAHNSVNLPLNRDMQMVLDRMASAGLGAGAPPAQPPAAAPPAEGGQEHVLISGYRSGR
ncbi:MAG: hypothetical protein QM767_14510 [Anaeromyxobacter sp.]